MIDIRKPLEGVPGLLLMAALIFFGATIGIGVALVFTWIPMSDALANFLGGVVGAGLGAALAVMGAVYVQRRDRRDALVAPANEFILKLESLRAAAVNIQSRLEGPPDDYIEAVAAKEDAINSLTKLQAGLVSLAYPYVLGRAICKHLQGAKYSWSFETRNALELLTTPSIGPEEQRRQLAVESLKQVTTDIEHLLIRLRESYAD